ncbi:MAG: hypothetical protein ACKESB_00545 [Candidatus Hodgkinia cicadicola]
MLSLRRSGVEVDGRKWLVLRGKRGVWSGIKLRFVGVKARGL